MRHVDREGNELHVGDRVYTATGAGTIVALGNAVHVVLEEPRRFAHRDVRLSRHSPRLIPSSAWLGLQEPGREPGPEVH
jgi:hypothetical protein